jgi:hypothetical protein
MVKRYLRKSVAGFRLVQQGARMFAQQDGSAREFDKWAIGAGFSNVGFSV